MVKQEVLREKLCYGKDKDAKIVEMSVKNFFKLKGIIEKLIGEKL